MNYWDNKRKLEWEIRDLKEDDPRYTPLKEEYDRLTAAYERERANVEALVMRILELLKPIRGLSRSKIASLTKSDIISLGKALKNVHDVMNKKGMIELLPIQPGETTWIIKIVNRAK